MLSKIPEELRLIISRQFDEHWDLDQILKAFKTELQARERCAGARIGTINSTGICQTPSKGNFTQPSASALISSNFKITCTYCKNTHASANCNIITDLKERKNVLRKQERCFLCLKRGHIAKFCDQSSVKCRHCSSRHHHSSLCSQIERNSTDTGDQRQVNSTIKSTTTSFIDSNTSVLLQTARVLVANPENPEHKIHARLIFNTGSQRSYVSTNLRDKLQCPTVKTETLLIKTFGKTRGNLELHDLVKLSVQGLMSEEITELHAYAVPTVCAPLENQAVGFAIANYPHLRDLPMADYCANTKPSELSVDILIGADHYWNFFTGGISRGEDGPVAFETCLGWVLSGAVPHAPGTESTQVNITTLRVDMDKYSSDYHLTETRNLEKTLTQFWDWRLSELNLMKCRFIISLKKTFRSVIITMK